MRLLERCVVVRALGMAGIGLALAGCDPATLPGPPLLRPAPLVDYSAGVAYADPKTGQILAGSTPDGASVTHAGFATNSVPVLDMQDLLSYVDDAAQRDFVQDALLQRSDVLCERYLDGLFFRVTARRTVLGGISQVASAIGAFSTGAQAANVAALVANIAGGTNNLMDSEILQSQLVTLITKQIATNRTQVLGMIMTSRRTKQDDAVPLTKYPLSLALRDAMSYHQQCSFVAGVTGLSAAANKPNPTTTTQSQAAETAAANASANAMTEAAGIRMTPAAR